MGDRTLVDGGWCVRRRVRECVGLCVGGGARMGGKTRRGRGALVEGVVCVGDREWVGDKV